MPKKEEEGPPPIDGPFAIPESMFPPTADEEPDPAFTDDDVRAAMQEAENKPRDGFQWVTEGEPELAPEPEPPPGPPTVPPAADKQSWVTEGSPQVAPEPEPPVRAAPPPPEPPRQSAPPPQPPPQQPPPPKPRPAMESSGLVIEGGGSDKADETEPIAADDTDLVGTGLNTMALGIVATLLGVAGAGCLVGLFVMLTGPADPQPAASSAPPPPKPGQIEVRKGLQAPPRTRTQDPATLPGGPPPGDPPPAGTEVVGEIVEDDPADAPPAPQPAAQPAPAPEPDEIVEPDL